MKTSFSPRNLLISRQVTEVPWKLNFTGCRLMLPPTYKLSVAKLNNRAPLGPNILQVKVYLWQWTLAAFITYQSAQSADSAPANFETPHQMNLNSSHQLHCLVLFARDDEHFESLFIKRTWIRHQLHRLWPCTICACPEIYEQVNLARTCSMYLPWPSNLNINISMCHTNMIFLIASHRWITPAIRSDFWSSHTDYLRHRRDT